jgi:hypothetical protein
MVEIYPNVFVGNDDDFYNLKKEHIPGREIDQPVDDWFVLHAAKEPHHRQFLGYVGRGAPKDSPEYLFARRGNRMALNMVDAKSPEFFSNCNQGESRGPSVAMLFVFKRILKNNATFEEAEAEMKKVYPAYNPGEGIRGHLMQYWGEY